VRILLYHRVSDDRDPLSVSPQCFRRQMEALAESGVRAVNLAEVAERLFGEGTSPDRIVGLTFDDGYVDIVENALPVLEQHGFQATVFVATGLVDGTASPEWYERPPPILSWPQIVELDKGGTLHFEAHSVTHRNLRQLDDQEVSFELEESKRVLERRLDREVGVFSYPGGVLGDRERALAQAAGYRLAVSCEPGVNRPGTDRFSLSRIQIDARDNLLDFRAKVGGGHDTGLPGRSLYRRLRYGAPIPARASSLAYRSR
jgi:peptidoglycan/xylan/chitin deacetylase (PgdA/CDA1 family)